MLDNIKTVMKNSHYGMWFFIVNSIAFLFGSLTGAYLMTFEDGTNEFFTLMVLFGTYLGCIVGAIYYWRKYVKEEYTLKEKMVQASIPIVSIFFPVLSIVGAALGLGAGCGLMKLVIYFIQTNCY